MPGLMKWISKPHIDALDPYLSLTYEFVSSREVAWADSIEHIEMANRSRDMQHEKCGI